MTSWAAPMGPQVGTRGPFGVKPRPAVRIDDVVIFADGTSRELTEDELRRLDAGEDVRVDPRSGQRTRLVGEVTLGDLIVAFEGHVT